MLQWLLNRYKEKIPFDSTSELNQKDLLLGLEIIIATFINVSCFILLFGVCGYLKYGLIFLAVFCWFRGYVGGIHMKTQFRCFCLMVTFAVTALIFLKGLTMSNFVWGSSLIALATLVRAYKLQYPKRCIASLLIIYGLALMGTEIGALSAISLMFVWITKLWEVKKNERIIL